MAIFRSIPERPTQRNSGATPYERCIEAVLQGSALVSVLAVASLFGFLIWFTAPLLQHERLLEVLTWTWRPFHGGYGILPMVVGSLALAATAMAIAYPASVGICCFVHGMGPRRPAKALLLAIHFMTGIPTVVYGFVAVFLLVPTVRALAPHGTGFCWLSAAVTLSLLILPTMVLVIDSQFRQIEPGVRVTAAALGFSRAQTLRHLVLPLSGRALITAAVLGFGRAVGDTLVALMVSGNAAQVPHSPLDSIRALTAHIALVIATDQHSRAYDSLFAAGLILLLTATLTNLALRSLRRGSSG